MSQRDRAQSEGGDADRRAASSKARCAGHPFERGRTGLQGVEPGGVVWCSCNLVLRPAVAGGTCRDPEQRGEGSQAPRKAGTPSPGERRLGPQHPLEERGHPALGFREGLDPLESIPPAMLFFLRCV